MTLSASTAVDRYAAAELQTVFPYTFKILDSSHLNVFEGDTEVTTGFTVSGIGSDSGGNVTYTTAPRTTGEAALTVTLKRVLPFSQPDDLPTQGALNTDTLEQMIDSSRMIDQQLDEVDQRSIKVPVSSSLTDLDVTPVASGLIGFNATPDGLTTYPAASIADTIIPTSFAESLLDDSTAAEARATLEVTAANLGADYAAAAAGIIETNAAFVDAVIFGPAIDQVDWSARTAAATASLMLATIEDAGADTELNIWDLTAADLTGLTPLATVTITGAATPTSIAAAMGYIIVGSENGITIIDPYDGAWQERTAGYPKSLSTTTAPALTSASILTVAAGLKNTNAPDPRTGGPLPSFYMQYAAGTDTHSFWNDDGYFATEAGTAVATKGAAFDGQGRLLYSDAATQLMRSAPLSQLAAPSNGKFSVVRNDSFPYGFAPNNAADARNGKAAIASTAGLTFALLGLDANSGVSSAITRAYNTGFMIGGIRGALLANSKTADRSYKANTLTETGTVTEAAVATSAELMGYSGFSASNYLSRANDIDFDFSTASFSIALWFKSSGNAALEELVHRRKTDGTGPHFGIQLRADGKIRGAVNDGTIAISAEGAQILDDGVWHQIILVWDTIPNTLFMFTDGVLVAETTHTSLGTMNMTAPAPLGVGTSGQNLGSDTADSSTLSLVRLSDAAPNANQVRAIYDAEKGMFVAGAKCLLQSGTTDAVLDVSVDPITGNVAVTQTDHAAIWDGMVIDSELALATGGAAWERNLLYGGDRVEINDANLYATVAAKNLRQDMETLRGLKMLAAPRIDLSKAKAWISFNMASGVINVSHNIKSITDNGAGDFNINLAVPFKTASGYVVIGAGKPVTTYDEGFFVENVTDPASAQIKFFTAAGAGSDSTIAHIAFFGELENE